MTNSLINNMVFKLSRLKQRTIVLLLIIVAGIVWLRDYFTVHYMTSYQRQLFEYDLDSQVTHKESRIYEDDRIPGFRENDELHNLNTEMGRDILRRTKVDCKDRVCSEFLGDADFPHSKYCVRKTWKMKKHKEPLSSLCRFINGENRYPVALASYPGSGNTWVRGLLQEVTGLCTGGVYCDITLRQNGFPGEGIRSGVVLAVKTHQTDPRWSAVQYSKDASFTYYQRVEHIPIFSSAVVIVRNPFDAVVAEYNRQLDESSPDSHILLRGPEKFGSNKKWNEFVFKEVKVWQETLLVFLLHNYNHPVMVVRYEDLKKNTTYELRRMLDFIQVPYRQSQLYKVVDKGYIRYKRKKKEFDHYTIEQREYVRSVIKDTAGMLTEHGLLNVANVSIYNS